MNPGFVIIYFVCFALIAGAAFAMMWSNVQSINMEMDDSTVTSSSRSTCSGEEVMYVDVSSMNSKEFNDTKKSLEDLYNQDDQ